MSYGAITQTDAETLELVLSNFRNKKLKFLEIGVWTGYTALGIRNYCNANNIELEYWGIDAKYEIHEPKLFDGKHGMNFVLGKSEHVHEKILWNFDAILVDGCHCLNHVILDAVLYGWRLDSGGFMIFHDTATQIQQVQTNPWIHKDDEIANTKTAVRKALNFLGWPNTNWELVMDKFDPLSNIGGMMVFRHRL